MTSPTECFTHMLLLNIAVENAKDGDNFSQSVSVFEDWVIIGTPLSDIVRAYLYTRVLGDWKYYH